MIKNQCGLPGIVANWSQPVQNISDSQDSLFDSCGGADMYNKLAVGAAFVCFAVTPGLAGDVGLNWTDISKDLKDLKADYKDLKADRADLKNDKLQFQNAIANGNLAAASKYAADIAADKHDIFADKRDIHADRKDLKHDGVTLPKGKR